MEEPDREIDYYDGVRFTAPEDTNAISPMGAAEDDDIIKNYMFWDGSVVDESGNPYPIEWEDGACYVIVLQPKHERTAIFNTFLSFQINATANPDDLLLNPWEYPGLYFEYPGDPVNLLSGSFSWNYTDFSLFGRYDMPFTRYYESTAYEEDHHFGRGWSTNYTYGLSVDLLYADFLMPQDRHVYFSMQPDGTYLSKAGSVFSLEVTDSDSSSPVRYFWEAVLWVVIVFPLVAVISDAGLFLDALVASWTSGPFLFWTFLAAMTLGLCYAALYRGYSLLGVGRTLSMTAFYVPVEIVAMLALMGVIPSYFLVIGVILSVAGMFVMYWESDSIKDKMRDNSSVNQGNGGI